MMYRPRLSASTAALLAVLAAGAAACGDSEEGDGAACDLTLPEDGQPFDRLSEYCFFNGEPAAHEPSDGVYFYDVNTVLYSDHSQKLRYIALPDSDDPSEPGRAKIGFDEAEKWEFPVGATIVKTFYYPMDARDASKGRQLLETRLLVREPNGWTTQTYLWNDEQTDAERYVVGKTVDVDWVDEEGTQVTSKYKIPAKSDCKSCHNHNDRIEPLGPRTRQLNREHDYGDGPVNQLAHFDSLGLFDVDAPAPAELPKLIDPADETQPLELRARTYLEGNCAHCHSKGGPARNSALFLSIDEQDPYHWGVCKTPVAAGAGTGGHTYDIHPGKPERSIMIYRMNSMQPDIKMPELPLNTIDEFGLDLVSQWIAQMDGECAQD